VGSGDAPVQVVVSVFADEAGEFAFDLETAPPQEAELVVEAPLHVDLRQKLPAGGVLEIAVVSRRRKLLERLVGWARRRGAPYDVRPEPTPGQVRRAAEAGNPAVAEWAGAIEQAAFDAGDVDLALSRLEVSLPVEVPGSPLETVRFASLEDFHPDRMASRILGMGDVVSLVERAQMQFDEKEAAELQKKIRKNKFDFNDFYSQIQQIKKMGNMKDLMGMIPGMGKALKGAEVDDNAFKNIEAIIREP